MSRKSTLLSALAAFLLLIAASAQAARGPDRLEGEVRWQGEVRLEKAVLVKNGAVLTIAAGSVVRPATPQAKITVQGTLKVEGRKDAEVVFAAPEGWQGIEFMEGATDSAITHARFEKAKSAISSLATPFALRASTFRDCATAVKLLREAGPVIEDCLFADNEIAIDNEMKSSPTIRGNRFVGSGKAAILASHNSIGRIEDNSFERNKQGIGLLQKYPDRIIGNRFADNETAIFCNQTQNTPTIEGNRFENNRNGLVNFSFSYPAVKNNVFIGNETAVRNDQFGSPLLAHNLFRDNETALYNNRKSNPKVEKNQIERNELAIFCDFSSYPRVRDNNFVGNAMGVELGIYQSADWEKRSGSKTIVQKEAQARRSQNPLLAQAPTEFSDFVDVSGNWWGEHTSLLEGSVEGGNLEIFFDRQDKPKVTYEGFGPDSYVLDRVVFSPWLERPVPDAGPEKKR